MVEHLDTILAECNEVEHRIFDEWGYFHIHWHRFGKDAVLQDLETEQPGHEVGVIADIVAGTAGLAKDVGYDLRNRIAFWRFEGRQTTAGNIAVTFSPSVIDAGEVYEMSIYHALTIDDYRKIFETHMIDL